jgi:hypothetical protein
MPAYCYHFPLKGFDIHFTHSCHRIPNETVEEPYSTRLMLPGAAVADAGGN